MLDIGDSIALGEVALPEGVEFASIVSETDLEQPVASVLAPQLASASEDDESEEGGEDTEGAGSDAEGGADDEAGKED